jgi:hypothetical protein
MVVKAIINSKRLCPHTEDVFPLSQRSATYHTKGRVFPTFNCMGNDLTPLGSFLMTHMFSLEKGKLCYCNVLISSRKLAESSLGVRRAYRINRYYDTSNKIVIVYLFNHFQNDFYDYVKGI